MKLLALFLLLCINIFIWSMERTFADLNSSIWYNIDNWVDRSRNHIFIDTIKQLRNFSKWSSTPRWEKALLWTDLYPIEDFWGVVMTAQKPWSIAWVYKWSLVLRNEAPNLKIELVATSWTVQNIVKNWKNITFEFNISSTADQLMFNITNTNGGVTSIKLLRPWYTSDSNIFTSVFLNTIASSKILRTMDLTATNNSLETTWWKRRSMSDPIQALSWSWVAWEYVIELANKTQKDIWINIPHKADDDYIKNLALLFQQKLNANSKIYVEYSNEVWNDIFWQSGYNYQKAQAEQNAGLYNYNYDNVNNMYYYWWRRTGLKTKQIWDIFRTVFQTTDFSKIRPVLWWQLARYEVQKTALKFLNDNYGAVNNYIYGVGFSFYLGMPSSSQATTVSGVSQYVNSQLSKWSSALDDNRSFIKPYKIKIVAYEWWFETHWVTLNTSLVSSYFKDILAYTDTKKMLDTWKQKTNGAEFIYYFWWASNIDVGYSYGVTDNLYATGLTYRQKALNEYYATSFTPISDADWFKKVYGATAPTSKLNINTSFTWANFDNSKIYKTSSFSYWNGWFPFLDLMKTSTAWSFGRWSDDTSSMNLDANGWVKNMINTKTWQPVGLIRSIFMSNIATLSWSNLIVYYDWEWEFQIFWATLKPELSSPWKRVYGVNSNAENLSLEITDINPLNYLRDIKIISSKYETLFLSGWLFHPDFISGIKNSWQKAIDFSVWTSFNKTMTGTGWLDNFWYQTWTKWVPFEVMIALSNQTNLPWIFVLWNEYSKTYVDVLIEKIKKYKSETLWIRVLWNGVKMY